MTSALIQERSPTRVDLAGGTLDCWPLYLFLNNPVTVNVAIDIFTYCELQPLADKCVILESQDLSLRKEYAGLQECLQDNNPQLELFRAHLRYWQPTQGFHLKTRSESPIGGGLGGSSSLCITMLKAFSRWLKRPLDPDFMVRLASHIEAQVLLKPTGTQDYFPPLWGGLNFITYSVEGPKIEVQKLNADMFRDRFTLVYTGRSHNSGINNWQVIKNYLDGDSQVQKAMRDLAAVSEQMQAALKKGHVDELPAIFAREFNCRVRLSEGFSSPEIQRLQKLAHQVGAEAKICGAGGGGCVLIWSHNKNAAEVRALCAAEGFEVLPTQPWEYL